MRYGERHGDLNAEFQAAGYADMRAAGLAGPVALLTADGSFDVAKRAGSRFFFLCRSM